MAVLVLFPKREYEWVEQMEPTFSNRCFEDSSGDRMVSVALLLAIVLLSQGVLLVFGPTRPPWLVSAVVVAVALLVGLST